MTINLHCVQFKIVNFLKQNSSLICWQKFWVLIILLFLPEDRSALESIWIIFGKFFYIIIQWYGQSLFCISYNWKSLFNPNIFFSGIGTGRSLQEYNYINWLIRNLKTSIKNWLTCGMGFLSVGTWLSFYSAYCIWFN